MADVGIITPVKNEIDNLPALVDSVTEQTKSPRRWVIVNDGSSDGSEAFMQEVAREYSWVEHVDTEGNSEYEMRSNYARVLSVGYERLVETLGSELDYYMVLDGDMRLTERYLETVADFLESSEDVVIASGGIYVETANGLELEARSPMHPAGGATLYEGEFYRDIDGPPQVPGVDSATEVKARLRGYDCRYLTDIDSKAIQSRPTGHKGNVWQNAKMRGSNNYVLGQRLSVMLAKALWMSRKPPFYYGVGMLTGYLEDLFTGSDRVNDDELIQYYRHEKPKEISKNAVTLAKRRLPVISC